MALGDWKDGKDGKTPLSAARLNERDQAIQALQSAPDPDVAWGDVTGKPSTFAPADHEHAIADVTGLQSALDGKQESGDYATAAQVDAKADQSALEALEARIEALEVDTPEA